MSPAVGLSPVRPCTYAYFRPKLTAPHISRGAYLRQAHHLLSFFPSSLSLDLPYPMMDTHIFLLLILICVLLFLKSKLPCRWCGCRHRFSTMLMIISAEGHYTITTGLIGKTRKTHNHKILLYTMYHLIGSSTDVGQNQP